MSPLEKYHEKRHFDHTPEPRGKVVGKVTGKLRFVIHKHEASSLHYDFRIEVDGVLASWAVPKGPSLDPTKKHLAVHVEDHPYEYKDFEGVIPEKNYGAGTVMIWDEGYYQPWGALASKDLPTAFQEGLEKGHIVFLLAGKKLHGEFALIKLHKGGRNDWLLVKARDQYATDADILLEDRSARSGRTMDEIRTASKDDIPRDVKPMLATLTAEAFDSPDWLFEIKWDGYRAITEVKDGNTRIYSRNNKEFSDKFPTLVSSFAGFGKDAVFDGEIVVVDADGRSDFHLIQDYGTHGRGTLVYYVFDLLYYDGSLMTGLPIEKRREILKSILPRASNIRFSEEIIDQGKAFFDLAKKQNLEGIVAKRLGSLYQMGRRGSDWLKIKIIKEQEAIILGYTKPRGARKGFGALVLGVYDEGKFRYIGNVGTGFDGATIEKLIRVFKPHITKTAPLDLKGDITWLSPHFVCEVKFQEWTPEGHMRQPVYLGLREDKSPQEVQAETAESLEVSSRQPFSNPDKVFWPESGITKGDLMSYYEGVSKYLLPHLSGRPESLNRYPDGITGEHFFQKNVASHPSWVETFQDHFGADGHAVNYVICNDLDTLRYIINLGCIDLNVWSSREKSPSEPDFLLFDLDPEAVDFKHVAEVGYMIRDILSSIGVQSYPKTTGKRGLHIYVPLAPGHTFEQSRDFSHLVAMMVQAKLPKITSLERSPSKRQGMVYLDYLQNREGATMAAPYSVRPVEGATVSTPLTWEELEKGAKPEDFTIKNVPERLARIGDIFAPTLKNGVNLEKTLEKLSKLNKQP